MYIYCGRAVRAWVRRRTCTCVHACKQVLAHPCAHNQPTHTHKHPYTHKTHTTGMQQLQCSRQLPNISLTNHGG